MAKFINEMTEGITEWDTQTFSDACKHVNYNIFPRWNKVINELETLQRTFDDQNKLWINSV